MKKKILGTALTLGMAATCALCATACDGGTPPTGSLTKAEYAEAFDSVATTYESSSAASASVNITVNDMITVDVNNQMVTACVQFVKFLRNLCNSTSFNLSDGFQDMAVIDTSVSGYVGNYKLRIKMDYDEATELITSTVYCDSDGAYETYLTFEIAYDFDTEVLDYFTITGAMGQAGQISATNVNYFKFDDGTLSKLNPLSSAFSEYAQEVLSDMDVTISVDFAAQLPDFSQEYVSAMLEGAGE